MRGLDKDTIDGARLLPIFAKRAGSVEKSLVHPRLQCGRQASHDMQCVMLKCGVQTLRRDEIVRHKVQQVHLERGAVGIEQRMLVAVAKLSFKGRAWQVRANTTAAEACTAALRSIHADTRSSPLHIEKGLASLSGPHG